MKREFLLLAQTRNPERDFVGGWYMSEKLDGIRCFWDGGISRGLPCSEVPWANTTKHARLKTAPIATGLWTRYAQPICAPDWWINDLPPQPLDGELTLGRGTFQATASIVKTTTYHKQGWEDVRYAVFDSPSYQSVFADGSINNTNYKKKFSGIPTWCSERLRTAYENFFEQPFYIVYSQLRRMNLGKYASCLSQAILPSGRVDAEKVLTDRLCEIEAEGGEGVMLRNGISFWKPERHYGLLKVKRLQDAEAMVINYRWAKPTDKERSVSGKETNKLLGLMGSLRVRMKSGVVFDLSGFTDEERQMRNPHMTEEEVRSHGSKHPGELVGEEFYNPTFPRGTEITFQFRELTVDNVPKEARFLRQRDNF